MRNFHKLRHNKVSNLIVRGNNGHITQMIYRTFRRRDDFTLKYLGSSTTPHFHQGWGFSRASFNLLSYQVDIDIKFCLSKYLRRTNECKRERLSRLLKCTSSILPAEKYRLSLFFFFLRLFHTHRHRGNELPRKYYEYFDDF